jgi:hypothetical protein
MDYLKLIADWLKSVRTMSIAGTVAACALFLPEKWIQAARIDSAIDKFRPLLWLVLVSCIAGILYDTGHIVFVRQKLKRRLRNLANDEKDIMRRFVQHNGVSHQFHESEGTITHLLVRDRILFAGNPPITGNNHYNFLTEPWIVEYLKKNKKLVGIQ